MVLKAGANVHIRLKINSDNMWPKCAQEPGTAEEIKKFAAGYHVGFRMMAKIDVNGSNAHPLWVFLKVKM